MLTKNEKNLGVVLYGSVLLAAATYVVGLRILARNSSAPNPIPKTIKDKKEDNITRSLDNVDQTIQAGEAVLKLRILAIKAYFTTRPNDRILEIPYNPIRKILKVENKGLHFYAIYDYVLGDGSYGQVLLAQNIDAHEALAVKVQPFSEPADIDHEVRQLSLIDEYHGSTVVKEKQECECVVAMHYLFSTLARGITVEKLYLVKNRYTISDLLDIIISGFYALKHIHDKHVVHNDVHEGNVVFNPVDKKSRWVDMAFSVSIKPGAKSYKINSNGTKPSPCYKAPESNVERGYSTDIYQLGFMSLRILIIMQELDGALKAKMIKSRELCFDEIKKKYGAMHITPSSESILKIYDLLYRMMSVDQNKRPTLVAAISEIETYSSDFKSKIALN